MTVGECSTSIAKYVNFSISHPDGVLRIPLPQYPQFTTEWAIPYEKTRACLRELRHWLEEEQADPHGLRPHFPLEIRFSDVDDIWLSPSYGQRTTWIGIIQYKYVDGNSAQIGYSPGHSTDHTD